MVEPPENSQEEWLRQSLAYVRNFSQLLSVELPDASVELDIPVAGEAAAGPPANCEVVLCSPHPDDEALTGSSCTAGKGWGGQSGNDHGPRSAPAGAAEARVESVLSGSGFW